jgi:GT2 family glycosyltransferase
MLSFVCVYNNEDTLKIMTAKSLEKIKDVAQLIYIDNTKNTYPSAADAFNSVSSIINGDWIVFLHQDIILEEKFYDNLLNILEKSKSQEIYGVAGSILNKKGVYSNIFHGNPKYRNTGYRVKGILEVQTLDECLFIVPINLFRKLKFDVKCCDGWHLYGVDYCLSALEIGYKSYVFDSELHHWSDGSSMNKHYFTILRNILIKHSGNVKTISTTMGFWRNYKLFNNQYVIYRQIRYKLKQMFLYIKKYLSKNKRR